MTPNNKNLEKALSQGYNLDFGHVIEKSFENFKKTWALGGLSFIIIGLIFAALMIGMLSIALGGAALSNVLNLEYLESLENFKMTDLSPLFLFGYMLFVSFIAGLSNVFYAGLYKMIDDAETNKSFGIDGLFYYFRSSYMSQLFLAGIILGVLTTLLVFIFEYINLPILGSLFQYVLSFFTVLTVPLVVFSNQSATDALGKSFQLVLKNPLIIFGLLIVAVILAFVGFIAFCIGALFTMFFVYIVIYHIYISAVPHGENSDLDLIGAKEEN